MSKETPVRHELTIEGDQQKPKSPPSSPIELLGISVGSLIPGTLFSIGFIASMVLPVYLLLRSLDSLLLSSLDSPDEIIILTALRAVPEYAKIIPSPAWLAAIGAVVGFVGFLFYIQDPKVPNRVSFRRLFHQLKNPQDARGELACASTEECDFPFLYYREYLERRGLDHLRPLVTWGPGRARTKWIINLLKIRLHYHYPDRFILISRNEAHVRLASSAWHVAQSIQSLSYAGIAISVGSMHIALFVLWGSPALTVALYDHASAASLLVTILLLTRLARGKIESVFHYQRLREVFFVLETCYTAFKDRLDLLEPCVELTDDNPTPPLGEKPQCES